MLAGVADQLVISEEDRPWTVDELERNVRGFDAVLCMLHDPIDLRVLQAANGCRIFANMAVGFNNIDVVEATKLGIMVTNTPGVLTEATADLAWALILAVARRVADGDRVMRAQEFPGWGPNYLLGGDVTGRTLGLVGPGRIAQAVARRSVGFEMPLVYSGRRQSPTLEALGARWLELDELMAESDFISLHVPLTPETTHLIDARRLGLMKPSAYLINTARGPVVDETALVSALKSHRIAGAGLDVYEREPAMAEGLAGCLNAVLLPHLGSATLQTRSNMSRIAAENIIAALNGDRPANLINPDALPGTGLPDILP